MLPANENRPPLQIVFENRIDGAIMSGLADLGPFYVSAYLAGSISAVLRTADNEMKKQVMEYLVKEVRYDD